MVYDALYTRVINSYAAGLDEPVTIMDLADMEKQLIPGLIRQHLQRLEHYIPLDR